MSDCPVRSAGLVGGVVPIPSRERGMSHVLSVGGSCVGIRYTLKEPCSPKMGLFLYVMSKKDNKIRSLCSWLNLF